MIPKFNIKRIQKRLKGNIVNWNDFAHRQPMSVGQKIHHVEVRYYISGIERSRVEALIRIVQTAIQEMLKLMRARGETDIILSDHRPRGNNVYLVLRSAKGFDPDLLSIFLSYLYFEPVQDDFWLQFWQNKQRVIDLHRYDPKLALNPVDDDQPQIGNLLDILMDTLPLLDIPLQQGNKGNSYMYLFDALGDKEYRDATCDRIYIGFFRKRTSEQTDLIRKRYRYFPPGDTSIAFADVGNDAIRMIGYEEDNVISKHIRRLNSYE